MRLFDAHCHLQMPQFDEDREAVLARMRAADMGALLVGTDYEISKAGLELARQHDFLWASVGLHPNDNVAEDFDAARYEELVRDPKVVAIGECGLDYFRSGNTPQEKEIQKRRFLAQIELALKVRKALIIHCRDAHSDLQQMLQIYSERLKENNVPVVIHFFTGSGELAQIYLDLSCYLSFPGPVTYTDMYDESIRVAPLDKMLVETDSPFAAPVPFRGKRNEPAYVAEVINKIATIKNLPRDDISRQIVLNSQRVFGV